jgi:hypothetical protein
VLRANLVIPAKAGIHDSTLLRANFVIPAKAGIHAFHGAARGSRLSPG